MAPLGKNGCERPATICAGDILDLDMSGCEFAVRQFVNTAATISVVLCTSPDDNLSTGSVALQSQGVRTCLEERVDFLCLHGPDASDASPDVSRPGPHRGSIVIDSNLVSKNGFQI